MITFVEIAAYCIVLGTIPFIIMTLSYFLAPKIILPEKNEYVKFALVFFSAFLVLMSAAIVVCTTVFTMDSPEQVMQVLMLSAAWFFPLLFSSYCIYKFKTVKKNRHVSFFLFWPALASLPAAIGSIYGIIVNL